MPAYARMYGVVSRSGTIGIPSLRLASTSAIVGKWSSGWSTVIEVVPRIETEPPGTKISPSPGALNRLITRLAMRDCVITSVPFESVICISQPAIFATSAAHAPVALMNWSAKISTISPFFVLRSFAAIIRLLSRIKPITL